MRQTMTEAIEAFGWKVTPTFVERYTTDPWVFNLANALERLTGEVERLRGELRRVMDVGDRAAVDVAHEALGSAAEWHPVR